MKTTDIGNITELKVAARLAEMGFLVLMPYGGNAAFDLVAYKDGEFTKIQCKAGKRNPNGTFQFSTRRVNGSTRVAKHYSADEIDSFASWDEQSDEVYLVPIEEATRGSIALRFAAPKNNQCKRIKRASTYVL